MTQDELPIFVIVLLVCLMMFYNILIHRDVVSSKFYQTWLAPWVFWRWQILLISVVLAFIWPIYFVGIILAAIGWMIWGIIRLIASFFKPVGEGNGYNGGLDGSKYSNDDDEVDELE